MRLADSLFYAQRFNSATRSILRRTSSVEIAAQLNEISLAGNHALRDASAAGRTLLAKIWGGDCQRYGVLKACEAFAEKIGVDTKAIRDTRLGIDAVLQEKGFARAMQTAETMAAARIRNMDWLEVDEDTAAKPMEIPAEIVYDMDQEAQISGVCNRCDARLQDSFATSLVKENYMLKRKLQQKGNEVKRLRKSTDLSVIDCPTPGCVRPVGHKGQCKDAIGQLVAQESDDEIDQCVAEESDDGM